MDWLPILLGSYYSWDLIYFCLILCWCVDKVVMLLVFLFWLLVSTMRVSGFPWFNFLIFIMMFLHWNYDIILIVSFLHLLVLLVYFLLHVFSCILFLFWISWISFIHNLHSAPYSLSRYQSMEMQLSIFYVAQIVINLTDLFLNQDNAIDYYQDISYWKSLGYLSSQYDSTSTSKVSPSFSDTQIYIPQIILLNC